MNQQNRILIQPGANTLNDWRKLYRGAARIELSDEATRRIIASRRAVDDILRSGQPVYGVNTGFGKLSHTRIEAKDLATLQHNLVLSHTVGVGEPIGAPIVRLLMALKVAALAQGASGARLDVAALLCQFIDKGLTPWIPSQGSVGASGDLAPLAHLSAVMLGRGKAWHDGRLLPGSDALALAGLTPLTLEAKEGLALLNGTQVSTAFALGALFEAERLHQTSLLVAALTAEAALGSTVPFDARIHALKAHPGQISVARQMRRLLEGGDFRRRNLEEGRLQDPYCLRCIPQVLGACEDILRFASEMLAVEAVSASDNPLILMDDASIVSGGNFHAEPVAFAADMMANAICEIGGISERRIAFLIDSSMSGLPPFLTNAGGLTSGFMSLQITAAALVADNRQRSHPASVDSIPTVGNQEDYVSMATHGAKRLFGMIENAHSIVAIELLAAVEGMDHRVGLRSNTRLEAVRETVRSVVPSMASDWEFSAAVEAANRLVHSGDLLEVAQL